MMEPENNEHKIESISKVIHLYKNVNVFIHDFACKLAPCCIEQKLFPQIETWAVDRFHGAKHNQDCKFSPYNDQRIADRLDNVNTSRSE